MSYYFYILESKIDSSFYYGSTKDIEARLKQHNSGNTKSTRNNRPWKLKYSEEFSTQSEAKKREKQVKKWKSRRTVIELIKKSN